MLRDALETMSRRDAVQAVAEMSGRPRKVYAQALALDKPDNNKKKSTDDTQAAEKDDKQNADRAGRRFMRDLGRVAITLESLSDCRAQLQTPYG